jgi:ComF family protein
VPSKALSDKYDVVSIANFLRPALDFVLPPRCPSCGAITPEGGPFCAGCWQQLRFLAPPWCDGCALPFDYQDVEGLLCADCLASPPHHDGIRAAVAYDEISRQVALKLKYGGKIGLSKMIAMQLVRHVPESNKAIWVAPVPLHWTRLWSRSFNQSALIAKDLSVLKGLTFVPDLLTRTKRTPSLRGLSPKQRRQTVSKAFTITPRYAEAVKDAHIILVDDVLTTGATADACVKALKKAGAQWVQVFCWARALKGEARRSDMPLSLDA